MTETAPPPPEPPAPTSPARPRLLINGEPMRPEELGRILSETVLRRLHDPKARPSTMIETLDLPPVPLPTGAGPESAPRRPGPTHPERSRGTLTWGVILMLGLALALYLLLR